MTTSTVSTHAQTLYDSAISLLGASPKYGTDDYRKAFSLLHQAANEGLPEAYYQLGIRTGELNYAFEYFRKAAELGHVNAQHHLAEMYLQGRGTPKNVTEGMDWHRKAAALGHTESEKLISRIRTCN